MLYPIIHTENSLNYSRPVQFPLSQVYCPRARALVHVRPLPPGGIGARDVEIMSAVPQGEEASSLSFLGPMIEDSIAEGIAQGAILCLRDSFWSLGETANYFHAGHLDPSTRRPYDLQAIYRGCRHLPKGVAQELSGALHVASVSGQQHGRHHSGMGSSSGSGVQGFQGRLVSGGDAAPGVQPQQQQQQQQQQGPRGSGGCMTLHELTLGAGPSKAAGGAGLLTGFKATSSQKHQRAGKSDQIICMF